MTLAAPVKFALRAALVLAALGALFLILRPSTAPQPLLAMETSGRGADSFDAALAERRQVLSTEAERAAAQPDSWLAIEREAMARYHAAKLAGDFAGMDRAYRQLEAAQALAPENSGPMLSRATLAFAIHRLDETEAALDVIGRQAVRPLRAERAEITAMRGDVAFYRGDYDAARILYEDALAIDAHPGLHVRMANWHQRMGDLDASMQAFRAAADSASAISPELASTLLLYAGGAELKRGDWDAAIDFFERADRVFPGYWLTQAHLAQMEAATGDLDAADRRYRDILANHAEPSVMAAYASVLEARGDTGAAERMTRRAEQVFAARAEDYPEAFADHVLDGAIGAGEIAAAVAAAKANHAGRPYGDAKVGMARALIAADRPDEARRFLDAVEQSGWRSTEQYVAMMEACEALGDRACVRQARRDAEAFNPMAFDAGSDFLAFGNH